MNKYKSIIEFFDSDNLNLPISWEGEICMFDVFLKDKFRKFLSELEKLKDAKDVIGEAIYSKINTIKLLICGLEKCVKSYVYEDKLEAESLFSNLLYEESIYEELRNIFSKKMNLKEGEYDPINPLYRVRIFNSGCPTNKYDLFHIPFELKNKAATGRYSSPELLCLYLGDSLDVCFKELNIDIKLSSNIYISCFKYLGSEKILDFGWRPAYWAARIDHIREKNINIDSIDESIISFIIANGVLWPLIAISSIKLKNNNLFKFEYVIPQLLLKWITEKDDKENKIAGIRYFSTKIDEYNTGRNNGIRGTVNFVFPTRTKPCKGYCEELKKLFKMTDPEQFSLFNTGCYDKYFDNSIFYEI